MWSILMTATWANAQESSFSYDPSSPVGPANWGKLPGSSCSGLAQSGIDVPTTACTEVNVDA
jgi:carbonic anhydrase